MKAGFTAGGRAVKKKHVYPENPPLSPRRVPPIEPVNSLSAADRAWPRPKSAFSGMQDAVKQISDQFLLEVSGGNN
jgi:hypothetical protein